MSQRGLSGTSLNRDLPTQCRYAWLNEGELPGVSGSRDEPSRLPTYRCKHAACVDEQRLYVHGGRNGGVCYRELWALSLDTGDWEKLRTHGNQPLSPQEHTMVAHKRKLYVFGGQFCCSTDKDPPLWILDLDTLVWRRQHISSEVLTPSGRRGHSAVVYNGVMCVYGGYVDLKGSSSEIWTLDLDEEIWNFLVPSSLYDYGAGGRHSHSAVVCDGAMWVFGGMCDLQPKDDFWRWDFICSQWNRVKVRPSPPPLTGHTACCVQGQMIIYGGSQQGALSNALWCFHFSSSVWTKLYPLGVSPSACIYHTALVLQKDIPTDSETARCHSLPQLEKKHVMDVSVRPFSSPPAASSDHAMKADASAFVFKNKICPTADKQSSQEKNCLRVDLPDPKGFDELWTCDTVKEKHVTQVRPLSDWSPQSACSSSPGLMSESSHAVWCRSMTAGDGGDDKVMSQERIPLMSMAANKDATPDGADSESLNSVDFMDTVGGTYVNRLLTAVKNWRHNPYEVVPCITDDSPASVTRQKSDEGMLNSPTASSHTRHVSEGYRRRYVRSSISRSCDELFVEDLETPDLSTVNRSSEELFPNGSASETAPLLLGVDAEGDAHQTLTHPLRGISLHCFSSRYSRLSNSTDSLPYTTNNSSGKNQTTSYSVSTRDPTNHHFDTTQAPTNQTSPTSGCQIQAFSRSPQKESNNQHKNPTETFPHPLRCNASQHDNETTAGPNTDASNPANHAGGLGATTDVACAHGDTTANSSVLSGHAVARDVVAGRDRNISTNTGVLYRSRPRLKAGTLGDIGTPSSDSLASTNDPHTSASSRIATDNHCDARDTDQCCSVPLLSATDVGTDWQASHPPPSYDSLTGTNPPSYSEAGSLGCPALDSSLESTPSAGDAGPEPKAASPNAVIPTAWKNPAEKNEQLPSVQDKLPSGGTGSYTTDEKTQSTSQQTTPQRYIICIVGGQMSDGKRYDTKPIQVLPLEVTTGVR